MKEGENLLTTYYRMRSLPVENWGGGRDRNGRSRAVLGGFGILGGCGGTLPEKATLSKMSGRPVENSNLSTVPRKVGAWSWDGKTFEAVL